MEEVEEGYLRAEEEGGCLMEVEEVRDCLLVVVVDSCRWVVVVVPPGCWMRP